MRRALAHLVVVAGLVAPPFAAPCGAIEVGGRTIPKDKFIVILIFGDSNAQIGGGWARGEDFKSPNLWALDWRDKSANAPKWVPAGLGQSAIRGGPEMFKGGAGLGFPLLKHLARAFPDYHFGYVNLACAGTSFRMTFFDEWVPYVKPLISQATLGAAICEYSFQAPPDYLPRVEESLARLRKDLAAPDLPVVLGQLRFGSTDPRYDFRESADTTSGMRGVHASVRIIAGIDAAPGKLPRVAVVPTEGLNMYDNRHQRYWAGNEPYAERFVLKLRALGWCVPGTRPDTEKPSTPANLRVLRKWQTGVTLAWDAARDNLGVEGYDVFLDGRKVQFWPTFPPDLNLVTTVGTEFPVTGLEPGAACKFTVRAKDYAGNLSPPSAPLEAAAATQPDAALKLPIRVNLGGAAAAGWLADKEFRDGCDYGYVLSPAERGDWLGRDYQPDPDDRRAGPWFYDSVKRTYPDGNPLRTVFQTFRRGNTAYRFNVPDGKYRLTWWMDGAPDPKEPGEKAWPDRELAALCRVRVEDVEAGGGRLIARLAGAGRAAVYAVTVEPAR